MMAPDTLHAARMIAEARCHPYSPAYSPHVSVSSRTQSDQLGRGIAHASGQSVRVYIANEPIPCWGLDCPRTIAPGELFTRRTVEGGDKHRVYPHCRMCVPFDPPPGIGGKVR